jgi:type II secretory pathway pseudopilin PulG
MLIPVIVLIAILGVITTPGLIAQYLEARRTRSTHPTTNGPANA